MLMLNKPTDLFGPEGCSREKSLTPSTFSEKAESHFTGCQTYKHLMTITLRVIYPKCVLINSISLNLLKLNITG